MREIHENPDNSSEDGQIDSKTKIGGGMVDKIIKIGLSPIAKLGEGVSILANKADEVINKDRKEVEALFDLYNPQYKESLEGIKLKPSEATFNQAMLIVDEFEKQLSKHHVKLDQIGFRNSNPETLRNNIRETYARAKQAKIFIKFAKKAGYFDRQGHKEE
jgi:undecaprenyl pyrophosphate synthase